MVKPLDRATKGAVWIVRNVDRCLAIAPCQHAVGDPVSTADGHPPHFKSKREARAWMKQRGR